MIARKLGEEATEAVVAALAGDDEELIGEAADVLFHLMVLLAKKGIPLAARARRARAPRRHLGAGRESREERVMPIDPTRALR